MPAFQDLTGMKFGHWTVLRLDLGKRHPTKWLCVCECGQDRTVQAGHLKSGASTNCGCKRVPVIKHGQARTGRFSKKYMTWRAIKSRCNHLSHPSSEYYHGLLCTHWQNYENFDADVEDPPRDNLTIDRIDNTKGYEPGNVRWVTMDEQHRNQSNCRWIEFEGRRQLLSEWAAELKLNISSLIERIEKYGIEKALTTPKGVSLK